MSDLIIGAFQGYKWDQIKCWVNSIHQSEFEGKKVAIIQGNATDEVKKNLNDRGFLFAIVPILENVAPHVARFFWLWKYLDENPQRETNVFWSDVRDVVYQKNPSHYFDFYHDVMTVQSEGLKYKDEPWGKENFLQAFGSFFYEKYKHMQIYNVGTFCGDPQLIKDLSLMIFQMSINRPIPIVDQAVFNFLLYQRPINRSVVTDREYYAATLGTLMDPSKIEQFRPNLLISTPLVKDGVVYNQYDQEYVIVHQYDRVPGLKEQIEIKYG